jgi:S-adenosylmethionine hydrolase
MDPPRIVTLTTDFGLEDGYVAQMKGAALSICPELQFVDITHHVPAHDVLAGALHLKSAYAAFPPRTVHVAVVDPGVGTARRGVVVRTTRYVFVAPDNGILSLALEDEPPGAAHLLEARHFQRPTVSATFEGRDVFAPAAAWVARGIPIERFGPEACDLARLELPAFRAEAGQPVSVRALLVDRFGNVTLNVPRRGIGRGDDPASPDSRPGAGGDDRRPASHLRRRGARKAVPAVQLRRLPRDRGPRGSSVRSPRPQGRRRGRGDGGMSGPVL